MTVMTDVAVPVPTGSTNWTLIYTAVAAVTMQVQNRTPHTGMRIHLNGSSGATTDALTSPYMLLMPFERVMLTLALNDKVFATPDGSFAGKVTVAG
jgi:hypothetical protein